jgi:plasmid stability protein
MAVWDTAMGQILVRKLDDAVIEAVKKRAKAHNRSAEAEVRAIIEAAIGGTLPGGASVRRRPILELAGSVPSNRTTEEIVAEIRSLRDEWSD